MERDAKIQAYYQKLLQEDNRSQKLKSQKKCGHGMIKLPGWTQQVIILSNGRQSKIFGVQRCKNAWSCPNCTPHVMARYASDTAIAIKLLNKQGFASFLVTLAIPHSYNFTCKQSYEILKRTWDRFYHHGNKALCQDPFSNFCQAANCIYRIKVCEFTYGKNGWNPHFHCLFFVPKNKLQTVLDWQQDLSKRWLAIARNFTIKILKRDDYKGNEYDSDVSDMAAWVDRFYARSKDLAAGRPSFFVSLDDNGRVRDAKASDYICGWGADAEVADKSLKTSKHAGHYTAHQLIGLSYQYKLDGEDEKAEHYGKKYIEYALTTLRTRRFDMTKGLRKLVDQYKKTEEYIVTLKKKYTAANSSAVYPWTPIVWFDKQQWSQILFAKRYDNPYIVAQITEMAIDIENGRRRITEFLLEYDIDISKNEMNWQVEFITKRVFNHEPEEEESTSA